MWWGIRILIEAKHPEDEITADDLFEDRIVVIEADDEISARQKAQRSAESAEPEYRNQFGDVVRWKFVEILGAQPLEIDGPPSDGTEVFWSFLRRSEVDQLRDWQRPFSD